MYKPKYFTVGLDIGIASIGWSVIEVEENEKTNNYESKRLINSGIRLFNAAETPKEGGSLAEVRRFARGSRRRIKRRRIRLKNLRQLLTDHKFLSQDTDLNKISVSPWEIRSKALDSVVSDQELAKALLHISKRRGFKSSRKAVNSDDKEGGAYKKFIDQNNQKLIEKGYRTYGEMFYKDTVTYGEQKRNRHGSFTGISPREKLEEEIKLILETQKSLGNKKIDSNFIDKFIFIESFQLPFAKGDDIKDLIGKCTFLKEEPRAPKYSISNEMFIFWQELNKLNINKKYLTSDKRNELLNLALKSPELTFTKLRSILDLEENYRFAKVDYSKQEVEIQEKTGFKTKRFVDIPVELAEKKTFFSFKGYHEIRKKIEKVDKKYWEIIKENHDLLDDIACALTVYKTDEDITTELEGKIDQKYLDEILNITNFSKVGHLSLKAIRKINPYLKEGYVYSEACEKAGFDFQGVQNLNKEPTLPVIHPDEVRNPVVLRSLSQCRKVLNAIISKYGSPAFVHIELARDLTKNRADRNTIEKLQKENFSYNENIKARLKEEFGLVDPKGFDIVKYKLWKEQDERCIYSQEKITPDMLFHTIGAVEVDHILPHSRSLDDTNTNKVLVLCRENQNKKNKTPYEYFGNDVQRWHQFENFINSLKISRYKKQKLLIKEFENKDLKKFLSRDLNDTRYITRFLKNYIENNLIFAKTNKKIKVNTFNGQFTSFLRHRYGFNKDRNLNARHHALDAVLVAIANTSMVQKVATYSKNRELYLDKVKLSDGKKYYVDYETGELTDKPYKDHEELEIKFPKPWDNFKKDIEYRIFNNVELKEEVLSNEIYSDIKDEIKGIFVSRMPNRKVTGAAHEETIFSAKKLDEGKVTIKKPLTKIKLKDLDKMSNDDPRLKEAIRERLIQYNNDPLKAFATDLFKPSDKGNGNKVKSVKITENSYSGVKVHGGKGIAKNESMVRIDIFTKDNKFYMIPIYVADVRKGQRLPSKMVRIHKPESEWIELDSSFKFLFDFYQNDLIGIKEKGITEKLGYYISADRYSGNISIRTHDSVDSSQSEIRKSILKLEYIKKYKVSLLGELTEVKKEYRNGI